VLYETARCIGSTTNNQAEYQAILLALELARDRKARNLLCTADSQLIIYQLQGRYRIKDPHLRKLAEKVQSVASGFEKVTYRQVPREHPMITRADRLLNQSLDKAQKIGPISSSKPAQGDLFS